MAGELLKLLAGTFPRPFLDLSWNPPAGELLKLLAGTGRLAYRGSSPSFPRPFLDLS